MKFITNALYFYDGHIMYVRSQDDHCIKYLSSFKDDRYEERELWKTHSIFNDPERLQQFEFLEIKPRMGIKRFNTYLENHYPEVLV